MPPLPLPAPRLLSDRITARIHRAAEHRWSRAVRRGLLACLPLVMLAATSVLVNHLPVVAYQEAMTQTFGSHWKQVPDLIWQASFGIIALAMVFAISHALASSHTSNTPGSVTPAIVATVSLASFLALIHSDASNNLIPLLSHRGAFPAIFTAIMATECFLWLKSKGITPVRWFGHDADPALPHALAALLPGALTILLMFSLGQLFHITSSMLGGKLEAWLLIPFSNPENAIPGAIVMLSLIHLFWFFGIHGNITLDPLAQAHFATAKAGISGFIPPEVFSKTFYDVFVYQGGAGCTLGLLFAVLIVNRNAASRRVAKVALPCALINVNEPVLFGFPVVLNPFYLLPFILCPLVLFSSAALIFSTGLVPPPSIQVEWTTPPLLGGWIATGTWRGAALQVFNLGLGTLIYLPFVRIAEKAREMQNARAFSTLIQEVHKGSHATHPALTRQDDIGNLARLLAADLEHAAASGQLYLEYQPLTDHSGKASGVEALLRWRHPVYGAVPPFLAVHLAEENGYIHTLGRWVIQEACKQLGQWNLAALRDLRMSINVSPFQLTDTGLPACVQEAIAANHLNAKDIELEITETSEIGNEETEKEVLIQLAATGVQLAMDDFGMGYSSILYLRRFPIATIKIDGSLTRDVQDDPHCREIILSMTTLCRSTQVEVVAEHVETREQMKTLYSLGCHTFQGFLFSQPLPPTQCALYIRQSRAGRTDN